MKTIYLHIGHVKTGTSALQHYFLHNRIWLKEQGVLYPETGLYGPGQHKIALNLLRKDDITDFLTRRERHNFGNCFMEKNIFKNLDKEIKGSPCQEVLISSEYFIFLRDLTKLKELLSSYNLKIILMLRRQDLLLESFYRQTLLVGWSAGIERFLAKHLDLLGDYKNIINCWGEAFSHNALTVCDYGSLAFGDDIYKLFCAILDISSETMPATPSEADKLNISLDVNYSALIRCLNRFSLSEKFMHELPNSLRTIQSNDRYRILGSGTFLSPGEANTIFERFYEDNLWIENNFLNEKPSSLTAKKGMTTKQFSGLDCLKSIRAIHRAWEMYREDVKSGV